MEDCTVAETAAAKHENELFNDESNQPETMMNDESKQQPDSQQTEDDQRPDEDRSTINDDENSDEDEEDESDDEITITINDINNVVSTTNAAANVNSSFTYQPVNLNLSKRGPGQVVQNLTQPKTKPTGLDIEQAGQYNGQSIFDLNLDSLEDKPWRKPGADITDYFNYGFTEDTWKIYCDRQKRLRNEMNPNDTSTLINNDRLMSNSNTNNQNGNNIVLRTFTNHSNSNNNNGPSTSAQSNQNSNLQQIKSELMNNPLSSINENSKYGGSMQQQKKAGPPPGRKQFGQIEVINSGSQSAANANNNQQQQPPPQNIMQQPPINMNPMNMPPNLQQPRRPDIKENFIQVIGQRGGPPPQLAGMPPFGMPPYAMPPNNQMEFNQMMQNQMNYPPAEFMNQGPPPQLPRFPMNNNQMEMNFDDQQSSNNPLFREQDQDDRRNNDFLHGNRPNRNYLSRDYNSREDDYRRTRESRLSRDKDYETGPSRRLRSPPRRSR